MGNNQQQSCKVHVGLKRNPQMGHINCSRAQWHTDQKIAAVSAKGFAFSASNVANWNLPAHDSRPYIPSIKHHESSKTILCFVHYSHISQRGGGRRWRYHMHYYNTLNDNILCSWVMAPFGQLSKDPWPSFVRILQQWSPEVLPTLGP